MSYVYLISDGVNIKIGKSNNPSLRMKNLQIGSSLYLEKIGSICCSSEKEAFLLEKYLHRVFGDKVVNGEWFSVSLCEIIEVFKDDINLSKYNLFTETRNLLVSMDYTEELLNMTKPEGFMFKILMKNRKTLDESGFKKSNLTYIDNSKLTLSEKQSIKIAYKLLREKDLIVRYKRGHYIINPRLVISQDDWQEEERLYKEAVKKAK